MNLSEQFVRIAFLTIALHVIGLYVARTAYSDRIRYRRSIGLWISRISLSCSLLLPLGFSYKTVHVVTELQREMQMAKTRSTPVKRELQYVTEIATVSLQSGRTVSYSRLQRVADSGGCSGVRTGESRDYTERSSVPASGLSEGWVIPDDAKL